MSRDRRKYLRKYQNTWIKARREEWVKAHGPCALCGSDERLEVVPGAGMLWSRSKEVRELELAKRRVLCHQCRAKKNASERTVKPITHGTQSGYKRGCRCEICRACYSAAKKISRKKQIAARGFYT